MELASVYADFEKWLPGVFSGWGIRLDATIPACMEEARWFVRRAAALIESAVLDWLERENFDVEFTVETDGATPMVLVTHRRTPFPRGYGHGPTRLARLHDAVRQMKGGA